MATEEIRWHPEAVVLAQPEPYKDVVPTNARLDRRGSDGQPRPMRFHFA